MRLHAQTIHIWSHDYMQIKELYMISFPERERYSLPMLGLLALRRSVRFLAFYDGEKFCAMTYLIKRDGMVYIVYLATNPVLRSRGYGSAVLDWIRQAYPDCQLVLDIEPMDEESDNLDQRLRRKAFYLRNGFNDSGWRMVEGAERYDILCTGKSLDIEEVRRLLARFAFGTDNLEFVQAEGR